jgi:hypothetical protein
MPFAAVGKGKGQISRGVLHSLPSIIAEILVDRWELEVKSANWARSGIEREDSADYGKIAADRADACSPTRLT